MQLVGLFPAWTTPFSSVQTSGISNSSATSRWSSYEATTSQIAYGLTSGYGQVSVLDTAYTTSHSMTLTGLLPGKTYHFK